MRLTFGNMMRFWARLMFPPSSTRHLQERLNLKGDPPWEPWLHCAVWIAVWISLFTGFPADELDHFWIALGLLSPVVGFFSVWVLVNGCSRGWMRYVAIWTRMIADGGLALTIATYQIARWEEGIWAAMEGVILGFSVWYMLTLVVRDVRLIRAVERLATYLREVEGGDDAAWKIVESSQIDDRLQELLEKMESRGT